MKRLILLFLILAGLLAVTVTAERGSAPGSYARLQSLINDTLNIYRDSVKDSLDQLRTEMGYIEDDTANYQTAYGWGDHSAQNYLDNDDSDIDTSHWNAAYDWGDHSAQGYLNSLNGLMAFLHPTYFDTTTAAATDSLIVIYADSAGAIDTTNSDFQAFVTDQVSGTSDSLDVDTDGDGTYDSRIYQGTGVTAMLSKGANIVLTVDGSKVTISGDAAAGTADSVGYDTTGDATADVFQYNTNVGTMVMVEGQNIQFRPYNGGLGDTIGVYVDDTIGFASDADPAGASLAAAFQPLETTLTDIADGTINEDLDNTTNPWTDNEVDNALTITGYMQDSDINTFTELQNWVSDKTLLNEEDVATIDVAWTFAGNPVCTAYPWADNEIASSANWNTAYGWGDWSTIVGQITDDTTSWKAAVTALGSDSAGWNKGKDSGLVAFHLTDADSDILTEAEASDSLANYLSEVDGGTMANDIAMGDNEITGANEVAGDTAQFSVYIGTGSGTSGKIKLRGGTNGSSSFEAPATGDSVSYTLPGDDGNADEVLSTNGSGVLDWVPVSAAYADSAGKVDTAGVVWNRADSANSSADEKVQDKAGAMTTGNTESGITVEYQDGDGTIDYTVTSSPLADSAAVAAKLSNDANSYIDLSNDTSYFVDEDTAYMTVYPAADNGLVIQNDVSITMIAGTGPLTTDSLATGRINADTIWCDTLTVSTMLNFPTNGVPDSSLPIDTLTKSFAIGSIDDTYDFPFWKTPADITIIYVAGVCTGGTNVIGAFQEYNATGTSVDAAIDADWTITTSQYTDSSFTNAAVDSADWLGWQTTSTSGDPTFFSITVWYTED